MCPGQRKRATMRAAFAAAVLAVALGRHAGADMHDHGTHDHGAAMPADGMAGMGDMGGTTPAAPADPCEADPTPAGCAAYMYPDASANADLDSLCSQMSFMIGCSVRMACEEGDVEGDYCRPFSLLATICDGDRGMDGMDGCATYNNLCAPGGVAVAQCADVMGVPEAVHTMDTQVRSYRPYRPPVHARPRRYRARDSGKRGRLVLT